MRRKKVNGERLAEKRSLASAQCYDETNALIIHPCHCPSGRGSNGWGECNQIWYACLPRSFHLQCVHVFTPMPFNLVAREEEGIIS